MPPKSKNRSIPSFDALSGLAQELDAPLKSLVKSSQKLVDDYKSRNFEYISYKDFSAIMKTLEQINRQLRRCSGTTERMIRLGKQGGRMALDSCDINAVAKEVVGLLGRQVEGLKIRISARLGQHLPMASLGVVECHQILHNVLVNAVQAMPAGGKIRLLTSFDKPRNLLAVIIEDEGIGITPEHLSKVFEPFFTTKERGFEKNTGLGLSVVYSLVHAAGGDIRIQSSLRKGTSVHIHIPAVPVRS